MGRRTLSISRHPSTAPQTPSILKRSKRLSKISAWTSQSMNFYRWHLVVFSLVPMLLSAIFYASNGSSPVPFIDCMFMMYSASTVTGLNSALLGPMTAWQQVMIFLCQCVGSAAFVSIVVIMIRIRFFRRKFEYLVEHDVSARNRADQVGLEEANAGGREYKRIGRSNPVDALGHSAAFLSSHSNNPSPAPSTPATQDYDAEKKEERDREKKDKRRKKKQERLRADMIKRVDVPVRVNQMNVTGWLAEQPTEEDNSNGLFVEEPDSIDSSALATPSEEDVPEMTPAMRQPPGQSGPSRPAIQIDDSTKPDRSTAPSRRRASESFASDVANFRLDNLPRVRTMEPQLATLTESPTTMTPTSPIQRDFPRIRTIDFRDSGDSELRLRRTRTRQADPDAISAARRPSNAGMSDSNHSRALTRTATYQPNEAAITTGFGGFPNPLVAAAQYARSRLPTLAQAERNLTMRTTNTLTSIHSNGPTMSESRTKPVSYISFNATVGRNSRFYNLTQAQQEELGGVEYRALRLLLKIVASYWLFTQLIGVLIVAPWMSKQSKYRPVFDDPEVDLSSTWFVFFNLFSAYSNNGMSLVDESMIPFNDAYLLIFVMCFLIIAGNTAFPVFLRLIIWIMSKAVPSRSRTRETLQFLLDHPRRCFIYLFPSHQTWLLVFMLVVLNSIDYVSFLVLDIGNPVIEALPVGQRMANALLQTFAVRAAGFSIVPLSQVAPALQLLYVVMMYIAVYPIALSIRSSNVYESKALGIYEDEDGSDDESEMEVEFEKSHKASQYIGYHARKQLAFDMWWLVLAVWLICIIERGAINDPDQTAINIFTTMFEVCSAYATVGLSLGSGFKNTSLAGDFRTLGKLIIIVVMVRGRHRGLPLAIDRSVMLPSELEQMRLDETDSNRLGRRSSRSTFSARGSGGGLDVVQPETDTERVRRQRQASADDDVPNSPSSAGFGFTTPVTHSLSRGRPSESEEESSSSKEQLEARAAAAKPADRRDSSATVLATAGLAAATTTTVPTHQQLRSNSHPQSRSDSVP